MDRKRIAYCDFGLNAATNRSLLSRLKTAFAGNPVDVIGIGELVNVYHPRNGGEVWRRYGRDILRRRKRFADCLLRTRYSFKAVRCALRRRLGPERYWVTFPTRSRADGRGPG